jgi:nuclear receptor subfamily 1 group D protein 3
MFDFAERLNMLQLSDAEIGLFSAVVLITPDRPGLRGTEIVERIHNKLCGVLRAVMAQTRGHEMATLHTVYQELLQKIPDLRTLNTLHSEKLLAFKMTERQQQLQQQQQMQQQRQMHTSIYGSDMGDSCLVVDESARSPLSSNGSLSSGESTCSGDIGPFNMNTMAKSAPILAATLQKRKRGNSDGSSSDGSEEVSSGCPYKNRKLDSPSDSGIDSEHEKSDKMSTSTSGCSSPHSNIEDKLDTRSLDDSGRGLDDMPVLKKALQAPPLVTTNTLMLETYRDRPPKKFHCRKDNHPESTYDEQQQLTTTHSALAKTLMEAPKLSAEQQKRQDYVHTMIMRGDIEPPSVGQSSSMGQSSGHSAGHGSQLLAQLTAPPRNTSSYYIPPTWSSGGHCSGQYSLSDSQCSSTVVVSSTSAGHATPTLLARLQAPPTNIYTPKLLFDHGSPQPPTSSSPLVVESPQHIVELQVDITDSQPLNLSKKTPPPQNILLQV